MLVYLQARAEAAQKVQRFGSVIGLKAEKLDYYKELHANAWPEVLQMIKDCNIRNYSIYLHKLDDGNYYLFSYFEYTGEDFKADMAKMAADPMTQKWWKETDPCQFPVKNRADGEKWAAMAEVFHTD
ncbi:MAG: L-rhamnose mutarotase [Candidatus Hydrogenedentes bacterium]|nr:L-rhamnose mutarotase [Candidatus Hydrogenedentota bacterium]